MSVWCFIIQRTERCTLDRQTQPGMGLHRGLQIIKIVFGYRTPDDSIRFLLFHESNTRGKDRKRDKKKDCGAGSASINLKPERFGIEVWDWVRRRGGRRGGSICEWCRGNLLIKQFQKTNTLWPWRQSKICRTWRNSQSLHDPMEVEKKFVRPDNEKKLLFL